MIRLYMPTRAGSSLKGSWETSRNQTLIVCLVLDAGNVRKMVMWCPRFRSLMIFFRSRDEPRAPVLVHRVRDVSGNVGYLKSDR